MFWNSLNLKERRADQETASPIPTEGAAPPAEPSPDLGSPAETANDALRTLFDYASHHSGWLWIGLSLACLTAGLLAVRNAGSLREWWRKIAASFNWRSLLVSSLAAGLAWYIADWSGSSVAAFSAMAGLITSQVAMRGSWKIGAEIVAGSAAALLVASWILAWLGVSFAAIVIVALSASLVGIVMARENGQWIAVTAIIAASFGTGLSDVALIDRVLATLVGVVVGVSLSPFGHPARWLFRTAGECADRYGEAISALITAAVSTEPAEGQDLQMAREAAEEAGEELREALAILRQARTSRNNVRVEEMSARQRRLDKAALQAYSMAATVSRARAQGFSPPTAVQEAVLAAGMALVAAEEIDQDAWQIASAVRKQAERQVRSSAMETDQLLLASSLLVDARMLSRQGPPVEKSGPVSGDTAEMPVIAENRRDSQEKEFLSGWFR